MKVKALIKFSAIYTSASSGLTLIAVAMLLGLSSVSHQALAYEWYSEPEASVGVASRTNRTLTQAAHNTTTKKTVLGRVKLGVRSEQTSFEFIPEYEIGRTSGESGLDYNDYKIESNLSHFTEYERYNLDLEYQRDSTSSRDNAASVNEPDFNTDTRNTFVIKPGWLFALNEKTTLSLNANIAKITFDVATRTPFNTLAVSAGVSHQLNEKDTLSLTGSRSVVTIGTGTQNTRTHLLQLGYNHKFSDTMDIGATLTANDSQLDNTVLDTAFNVITENARNIQWGLNFNKKFERSSWVASLDRSYQPTLSPTSEGFMIRSDNASVAYKYQFSDLLTGNFKIAGNKIKRTDPINKNSITSLIAVITGENNTDRTRINYSAGLSWRLTELLKLNGNFQYVTEDRTTANDIVNDKRLFLSIVYTGEKNSLSR